MKVNELSNSPTSKKGAFNRNPTVIRSSFNNLAILLLRVPENP